MKTLDEVIESITTQSGLEIRNVRKPEQDRFWVDRDTYNDALQYLRNYRSDKLQWEADRKLWTDNQERVDETRQKYIDKLKELEIGTLNDPLTWDELKQMEGKPVWVEHIYYKKWLIVKDVYEETIVLDGNGFYTQYFSDDNEKETRWQAYRKEHK